MPDVTINIEQTGEITSEARMRSHKVTIDRPEGKGGTDRGAMGGELLLAGLGGCFMSNLLAAIAARDIDAKAMSVEVIGTLEEHPPRFSAMVMKVSGTFTDAAEMERLATMAEKACISANTLRQSVDLKVIVT